MSIDEYLTPDYRVIKAEPAPSTPAGNQSSIHTGVILTALWPTQVAVLH